MSSAILQLLVLRADLKDSIGGQLKYFRELAAKLEAGLETRFDGIFQRLRGDSAAEVPHYFTDLVYVVAPVLDARVKFKYLEAEVPSLQRRMQLEGEIKGKNICHISSDARITEFWSIFLRTAGNNCSISVMTLYPCYHYGIPYNALHPFLFYS